jgi:ribonuclease T1
MRLHLQRGLRLLLALLLLGGAAIARDGAPALRDIAYSALPPEARQTIELIRRGGPYPYARDGVVFGNYEQLLPARPRGYYREYTVPTPGAANRGARRIIAGGRPAGPDGEIYYTGDHYRSFQRVRE